MNYFSEEKKEKKLTKEFDEKMKTPLPCKK